MKIADPFTTEPSPHWVRLAIGPASVDWSSGRLRFVIKDASHSQLANAEIGDYRLHTRRRLPWRPPLRMIVRARFSHRAEHLAGTSGFGFWNNPFDLVTGDVLAPPNALWFFSASPRSDMVTAPGLPGNGFRAEMVNGGAMPGWLMVMASRLFRVPRITPLLYRVAQTRVGARAIRLDNIDMTEWHVYSLSWSPQEAVFHVDGIEVLRSPGPPAVPLGFVAWMDNQVAVARPEGEFRFALEAIAGQQWLELSLVEVESWGRPQGPQPAGGQVSRN